MNRTKIELILVIGAVISFLIDMAFLLPFGNMLLVVSLSGLGMFYFITGANIFASRPPKSDEATTSDIGFKLENVAGIVFACACIWMLFKIQRWPSASTYLTYGLVAIAVVLIATALKYYSDKTHNSYILKRAVVLGLLLLVLKLLPDAALIDIKYRSHPAYRDALKQMVANPGDTALRAKVMLEQKKLNN